MGRLRWAACLIALAYGLTSDPCVAQNPDPGAPARYGWGFRNFADTAFTWDIYSHSFFGVPLDSNLAWLTSSFDKLYFELLFHRLLPNPDNNGGIGNCYGVSLLSLMINRFGGYYGYCAPTSSYTGDTNWANAVGPDDAALHRIINIMHGRQVSLGSIENYLDQIMSGHSLNCNYGFTLAGQTIGKEGPCLVAITPNPVPGQGGGHAMIAYGVTDDGAGHGKIWIVDPNRLWAVQSPRDRGWYQLDSNYISCDLGSGKWSFMMSDPALWPTGGSGHLVIIPISLVGPPGRVPSSLGFAVGDLLSKLILTDRAPRGAAGGSGRPHPGKARNPEAR